jgi:septal ring factor EnvC (AmiA/AmiB activator)
MSSFEHEQDPATLREAVRLLERENERLHARLAELVAELARLQGQSAPEQLTLELARLEEQLGRTHSPSPVVTGGAIADMPRG